MTKRSAPPNDLTDELPPPSASDARYKPAAQPSVRSFSASASALVTSAPAAVRSVCASASFRASSAGPELEQLSVGTKLREAQPGLGPPAEHELRASRHVEEQCGKGVEALGVLELVHVVEDQHERFGSSSQRRDEARDPTRPQRVAGPTEPLEHRAVDRRAGVQRLRDVRQEDDGIVVAVVERDPGELATVACRPLREDDRLAVAGGCDDADDSTVALTGEAPDEPRALDEARPRRRHVELGPQQLERSRICPSGRYSARPVSFALRCGGGTVPPV